ncbi:hypothetical protein IG631_05647 [Alternaria alternata]|nr:hypothetical protein IG631_05647 [Alternaria alternata]
MEPSTKPGIAKRFVRRLKDLGSGRNSKSHPTVSECSPHKTSPRRPPIPLAENLSNQPPIASGAPASASHVTNTRNDSISHGGNDDRASTSSKNYEAITHHENPPSNDETHTDAANVTLISQKPVSQIKDTHSQEEVEPIQADAQITPTVPQTSSATPSNGISLLRMPGAREAKTWDEARLKFEKEHEAEWKFLNDRLTELTTSDWSSKFITADLDLPQCIQQNSTSKEVVHRMRRWLPSLASVKSVVMPIAALDPHKIAPICCAIVFSTTELFVNGPDPEFRTKALDAYFEAANTISEWISYETTSIQEPTEGVKELEKELSTVYIMALRLMHDIQHATYEFQADSKLGRFKAKGELTFGTVMAIVTYD